MIGWAVVVIGLAAALLVIVRRRGQARDRTRREDLQHITGVRPWWGRR